MTRHPRSRRLLRSHHRMMIPFITCRLSSGGAVKEDGSVSSLATNLITSEILDAARQSAETGRTVQLPLAQ